MDTTKMPINNKYVLVKALRLEKLFKAYQAGGKQKQEVIDKFTNVWGADMAGHFLWKYDDAESLIFAFDTKNLQLFIDKF